MIFHLKYRDILTGFVYIYTSKPFVCFEEGDLPLMGLNLPTYRSLNIRIPPETVFFFRNALGVQICSQFQVFGFLCSPLLSPKP